MTVDLSTLKVGDSVKLRCGGVIEIDNTIDNGDGFVMICGEWWYYNGDFFGNAESPFDIIEVIPKPEPVIKKLWINYYKIYDTYRVYDELSLAKRRIETNGAIYEISITNSEPKIERIE